MAFLLGHTKIEDMKDIPDLLQKFDFKKFEVNKSVISGLPKGETWKGYLAISFNDWPAQNTKSSEHWTRAYYYFVI